MSELRAARPPSAPGPLSDRRRGEGADTPLSRSVRGAGGEGHRWHVPPVLQERMTVVAREFRKSPTKGEALLWQRLRARGLEGRKFRRQQPIGPFIVDFFCSDERLIVEIDGPVHERQRRADVERQQLIESLGLRFVRLPDDLVTGDVEAALHHIRTAFLALPADPRSDQRRGGEARTPLSRSKRRAGTENQSPLSRSGRGAGGEGQ